MTSTTLLFCFLCAIVAWIWLFVNFTALRSYASRQGLPPAHAWKLFGQIWRDKEHEMRPALDGVIASTAIFLISVGVAMHFGHATAGSAYYVTGK